MSVAGQKKGIFDLHPAKAGQWPIVLKANGKFARESGLNSTQAVVRRQRCYERRAGMNCAMTGLAGGVFGAVRSRLRD